MFHPSNNRQLLILLAFIIYCSDLGACLFSKLTRTTVKSGIVPFSITVNCLGKEYVDIMTGKRPRSSWTPSLIRSDCVGKSLRYLTVIPVRDSYVNITMDCRGYCLPLEPAVSEATATYGCSKSSQAVSLTKTSSVDCMLPYVSKKKQFHCAAYTSIPQVFTRLTALDGVWYLTIPTRFIRRESPTVIRYSMKLKIGTAPFGITSNSGSIYNFDVLLQLMPYALNDRCRINPQTGMASSTWFSVQCSDLSKFSQKGGFYYNLFYKSGQKNESVVMKRPLTPELNVAFQVSDLRPSTPVKVTLYVFNEEQSNACFETKAVYAITGETFDKDRYLDAEVNSLPYGDKKKAMSITAPLVKALNKFSKKTATMANTLSPSALQLRRDENARRREKMLELMLNIKPENDAQDYELVKLINNLTNVHDELTRAAQKSASILYERSAVKLTKPPFANAEKFAEDLLTGIGSLLNTVSDRGGLLTGKVSNDTTNSFVGIASTLVKATTVIGHGLSKVRGFRPGRENIRLPDMLFGLKATNSSVICDKSMKESLISQSKSITATFSCSYDSVPKVSRLAISSLYMLRDPFAISDLFARMNFPVLSVNIFTENLNNVVLKSVVLEFSEPKTDFNIKWIIQTLKFTFQSNGTYLIPTYDSNFSIPSFEVTTPATSFRSLFINVVKGPFQLDIVVQYERRPTYKQLVTNSFHRHSESNINVDNKWKNYSVFIPSKTGGKNDTYHIVMLPLKNYTKSDVLPFISAETNDSILVQMMIGISSKSCFVWDPKRRLWSTDGCTPMADSSRRVDVVKCECLHLSILSANIFVLPNLVNPIDDSYLLLQFFDNPIVFSLLVYVWAIYVSLLYWCRRMDRRNKSLAIITVLANDLTGHIYFVGLRTRWLPRAGTTAKVFLILFGSEANSTVYYLRDTYKPCFKTGDESWFLLTTEQSIGELQRVSIWHDNSGPSPDWRLDHVVVQDFESKHIWVLLCSDWISVKRGLKSRYALLVPQTIEQLRSKRLYQFRTQIVDGFRNSHEWMSVLLKTPTNSFTHTQRLTCAFNLLLAIMLTSIMFYGIPTDNPKDQIHTGPIDISIKSLVISIETSMVIIPVGTFLTWLFSNVSPKSTHLQFKKKNDGTNTDMDNQDGLRMSSNSNDHPMVKMEDKQTTEKEEADDRPTTSSGLMYNDKNVQSAGIQTKSVYTKRQTKTYREITSQQPNSESNDNIVINRFTCCIPNVGSLPWWFIYVSWMINITFCLLCTYFIVLYGFKYGKQASINWLCSFFFSFSQSAVLEQPVRIILKAFMIVVWLSNRIKPKQFSLSVRKMDDDELLEMIQDHCHFEEEYTCVIPTPNNQRLGS